MTQTSKLSYTAILPLPIHMLFTCRWKYMRILLGDGNFKQEHLKMKYPDDDVSLSDGHGYMVGRQEFAEYRDRVAKAPAPSTKVSGPSLACLRCSTQQILVNLP